MAAKLERKDTGIYRAHSAACIAGRSKCACPFQATVYSPSERKLIRKHFGNITAARQWRSDAAGAVRRGELKAPTRLTLAEAAAALIEGMSNGSIYDRSGNPYKPATIRSYERVLRLHVLPIMGHRRVSQVDRRELQALVEQIHAAGKSASTVQNIVNPLQVIFRRARRDGVIAVDPTEGLELPRKRGRRDRVATRGEAQALLDALPSDQRAFWGTAFYGGARRGELRALRWSDINLVSEPATINIARTWDDNAGEVPTKSEAGLRTIPLAGRLRSLLVEHGLQTNRAGEDLVFGRTAELPFTPTTVRRQALAAWGWKNVRNPEASGPRRIWVKARPDALDPLTPHEARHCCASYLIEAGLNDLELMATIGHSDPRTTKMIYGHLFPDSAATIAAKLDAYHEV